MWRYILAVTALLAGCGSSEEGSGSERNYSYACLDSTISGGRIGRGIDRAGDAIRDLAVNENKVTDEVQNEYGAAFHKDVVANGTFKLLEDGRINGELRAVMNDLLGARDNPSNINYQIYAVNDTMINAFTFGGRIYVTTGMYKKCGGKNALLYAIVGHEIGHSEKGHIKGTIQEMIIANRVFGEGGETALGIKRLLTGAFNQRNELEADYYGTDLTNALGQNICAAVTFWKEMSEMENQYNEVEDFFRTHPFSSLRATCLQAHIRNNFNRSCD